MTRVVSLLRRPWALPSLAKVCDEMNSCKTKVIVVGLIASCRRSMGDDNKDKSDEFSNLTVVPQIQGKAQPVLALPLRL